MGQSPPVPPYHAYSASQSKSAIRFASIPSNIVDLNLTSCKQIDFDGSKNLKQLKTAQITVCQLKDISIFCQSKLPNLTSLTLCYNCLVDISDTSNLAGLIHLNVSNNNLQHLSLSHNKVESLDVRNNQINGIEINCLKLKQLDVSNNCIQHLTGMKCPNLENLNATMNRISATSGLRQFVKLKQLKLSDNRVESLQFVRNCSKLSRLMIENNNIQTADETEVLLDPELKDLDGYFSWQNQGAEFNSEKSKLDFVYRFFQVDVENRIQLLNSDENPFTRKKLRQKAEICDTKRKEVRLKLDNIRNCVQKHLQKINQYYQSEQRLVSSLHYSIQLGDQ